MKITNIEDLIVWQKSKELFVLLYKEFNNSSDFYFKNQLLRAALSISNNIAEGFDRRGDKEFVYFLRISKGSSSEVKSMILISSEIGILNNDKKIVVLTLVEEIQKLLSRLIKSLIK